MRDPDRARVAHLLRRATLVVEPERIDRLAGLDESRAFADVLADAPADITVPGDVGFDAITPWWVERMTRPGSGLHERMTWYWHTLLPTHVAKVTHQPLVGTQLSMFRRLALTDVGSILHAFALDGALMQYLDANRSAVPTPNENLARELMELFTVGTGHYSEDDVRQAALAMTGWLVDLQTGEISFSDDNAHQGTTTFLGEERDWDVPSIVDRLLQHPATAVRHADLLHRMLVGTPATDPATDGEWWATQGLSIVPMVQRIVTSEAFAVNRLNRPKSPLEFYASVRSITRQSGSELWQLLFLGQAPYRPPNVGGWPVGDAWLSPASLMPRAQMLAAIDLDDPARAGDASTDEILDLCGIHELTPTTLAALEQVEDDREVENIDDLRRARLRLALASPEFQLA